MFGQVAETFLSWEVLALWNLYLLVSFVPRTAEYAARCVLGSAAQSFGIFLSYSTEISLCELAGAIHNSSAHFSCSVVAMQAALVKLALGDCLETGN